MKKGAVVLGAVVLCILLFVCMVPAVFAAENVGQPVSRILPQSGSAMTPVQQMIQNFVAQHPDATTFEGNAGDTGGGTTKVTFPKGMSNEEKLAQLDKIEPMLGKVPLSPNAKIYSLRG